MANSRTLISAVTATTTGAAFKMNEKTAIFCAYLSSAGGTATVAIDGRVDQDSPWYEMGTMALSGASDVEVVKIEDEPWGEMRARVTAISSATVTVKVSE